ncbi:SH3 domain [Trinorchestia longiramus]|nr:SH3 domain [Trinorchestia longiramus]
MPSSAIYSNIDDAWASVEDIQFVDRVRNETHSASKMITSFSKTEQKTPLLSNHSAVGKVNSKVTIPKFTYFGDEITHTRASLKQTENSVLSKLKHENGNLGPKKLPQKKLEFFRNKINSWKSEGGHSLLESPRDVEEITGKPELEVQLEPTKTCDIPSKLTIGSDHSEIFATDSLSRDSIRANALNFLKNKHSDKCSNSEVFDIDSLSRDLNSVKALNSLHEESSDSSSLFRHTVDERSSGDGQSVKKNDLTAVQNLREEHKNKQSSHVVTHSNRNDSSSFSTNETNTAEVNDSVTCVDPDEEGLSIQYLTNLHESLADSITSVQEGDCDEEFIDSIEVVHIDKLREIDEKKNQAHCEKTESIEEASSSLEGTTELEETSTDAVSVVGPEGIISPLNGNGVKTAIEENPISDGPSEDFLKRIKSDLYLAKKKAHFDRRSAQRKMQRSKSIMDTLHVSTSPRVPIDFQNSEIIHHNYINNLNQFHHQNQLVPTPSMSSSSLLHPIPGLDFYHPDVDITQMNYAMQLQMIQRLRLQQYYKQQQIQQQQRQQLLQDRDMVQHIQQRRLLQLQKQEALRAEFSLRKKYEGDNETYRRRAASSGRMSRERSRNSNGSETASKRRSSSSPSKYDRQSSHRDRESRGRISTSRKNEGLGKMQDCREKSVDTSVDIKSAVNYPANSSSKTIGKDLIGVDVEGNVRRPFQKLSNDKSQNITKTVKTTVKTVENNGLVYSTVALTKADPSSESNFLRKSSRNEKIGQRKKVKIVIPYTIPPQDYDGFEEVNSTKTSRSSIFSDRSKNPYVTPVDSVPRVSDRWPLNRIENSNWNTFGSSNYDPPVRGSPARGPRSDRSSVDGGAMGPGGSGSGHDDTSSVGSESFGKDVAIVNCCFDDIERFIARLQHTAAATQELEKRRRSRKSNKKKDVDDGLLSMRAKPPPEAEFVEILQKFKLSFNMLGKLRTYIHEPNAPELVHFIFTPLALIVDASRDSNYGTNLPAKVVSPLLNQDAVDLLTNCLSSRETELWQSMGDAWIIPRELWKYPVPPYQPVFSSGWAPELSDDVRDHRESKHRPRNREDFDEFYHSKRHGGSPPPERYGRHHPLSESEVSGSESASGAEGSSSQQWLSELRSRRAKVVQVTYPRTANNDKELTVVRGEYLEVIDDSRKWWKCCNSRGQMAHVPHTIVTPYTPDIPEGMVAGQPQDLGRKSKAWPVYRLYWRPCSCASLLDSDWSSSGFCSGRRYSSSDSDDSPPSPPPRPKTKKKSSKKAKSKTPKSKTPKSKTPIPAPPPPPPPDFTPASTVAERPPKKIPANSQKIFAASNETTELMNFELKEVLSEFRKRKPHIDVQKTPDVYIDNRSSPKDVEDWLKKKGFSERLCQQFDGVDGEKLFSLSKQQLQNFCGENDGARLFSQITIQRNVSGYKTVNTFELKRILSEQRKRVETDEADHVEQNFDFLQDYGKSEAGSIHGGSGVEDDEDETEVIIRQPKKSNQPKPTPVPAPIKTSTKKPTPPKAPTASTSVPLKSASTKKTQPSSKKAPATGTLKDQIKKQRKMIIDKKKVYD